MIRVSASQKRDSLIVLLNLDKVRGQEPVRRDVHPGFLGVAGDLRSLVLPCQSATEIVVYRIRHRNIGMDLDFNLNAWDAAGDSQDLFIGCDIVVFVNQTSSGVNFAADSGGCNGFDFIGNHIGVPRGRAWASRRIFDRW